MNLPPFQFLPCVAYSPHEYTTYKHPYKRHRFPAEIMSHCGWLYFHFCLSYRDVEELMAARSVILTYEAVRYWCRKLGMPMPISSAAGAPSPATRGTWTRCFSRSTRNVTICGVLWIKTATSWIFSYR